jgi:hypothetical protein
MPERASRGEGAPDSGRRSGVLIAARTTIRTTNVDAESHNGVRLAWESVKAAPLSCEEAIT